ncbi:predicted protein [Chaetoceros tenuissimus]|uniref:Uncharacterized protein n=1 Tax=Chaetoceros tenuissimus TaxID=426638 RepID=A0AAD3D4E0_9STRA|nr:predicted protein [Chaetoceros tenuissimus]
MVCSLIQSPSNSEQVVHVASCTCNLKESAVEIKQADQIIPDLRSCLLLQDDQESASSLLSQDDDLDTASSISSQDSDEQLEYRVTWANEIVKEIRYRPKTHFADVSDLHYTKSDYSKFRQAYKEELIRTRLEQKRIKREEERKMRENQGTPISWLVNLVHSQFVGESSTSKTNATISNAIQSHKPKEVQIELLVDTLYIF